MPKEIKSDALAIHDATIAKAKKDIAVWDNLGDDAIKTANALVIKDDKSAAMVADVRKNMKNSLSNLEGMVKTKLDPLTQLIEAVRGLVRPVKAKFESAIKTVNDKATEYLLEKQKAEQEALALERKRREEEYKKKMIEQTRKGEDAPPPPPPPPAPKAPKPSSQVSSDSGASIGLRKTWTHKVTDFALLPDIYKMENAKMIKAAIASGKRNPEIPGVDIFQESGVSG